MAYKPPMHGRDHCPGGSDPIPCLTTTTIPWARFELDAGADISVTSGVSTRITGNTDINMDATTFQINSHNEVQVLKAGIYSVHGNTVWGTYGTSFRTVQIVRNSATTGDILADSGSANDLSDWIVAHGLCRLSANDKVSLWVAQHSGGAYTIYGGFSGGYDANNLEVRYMGANL